MNKTIIAVLACTVLCSTVSNAWSFDEWKHTTDEDAAYNNWKSVKVANHLEMIDQHSRVVQAHRMEAGLKATNGDDDDVPGGVLGFILGVAKGLQYD